MNVSLYKNCYTNCSNFHYYDISLNKTFCTFDDKCPKKYNKLILDKNECIDNCSRDLIYTYEIENICYDESFYMKIKSTYYTSYIEKDDKIISNTNQKINNSLLNLFSTYFDETTEEKVTNQNSSLDNIMINSDYSYKIITDVIIYNSINIENETEFKNIIKKFLNGINIGDISNGKDEAIIEGNILIVFTSTFNQRLEENEKNNITIDLKECEYILKNVYDIPYNDSLFILEYIFEEKGMKIPKIEYEVYYPLYYQNLKKLNLSFCEGNKIEISIRVNIDENNLEKYNSSSPYYNDICSKSTSESGTDITIKDRRNEFIENNMTLCEENCKFIGYNYATKKAKCSCDVKINLPLISEIKFNKDELIKSFTDIKNSANLNVMKCYKNAFDKSLIKNIGFFLMVSLLLLYFICLFIFRFLSIFKLKKEINEIFIALKTADETKIIKIKKIGRKKRIKKRNSLKNNNKKIRFQNDNKINNNEQITINNEEQSNNMIFGIEEKNKNIKEILEYRDFELNSLEYQEAIKIDKRGYVQFYVSLLRMNHPFIFAFFQNKDLNSRIIKIFLFFFFFGLNLVVNALFFTDGTIHKIYQDKGDFNFIYQIPNIIYSSLLSYVINALIKYLSLSRKYN